MANDIDPQLNGENRLRMVKHKGVNVMVCDFGDCNLEEGRAVLIALIEALNREAEHSVRVLINTLNAPHDASQSIEWKRNLPLFDAKLKKCAIIGLGPMNRIALAGMRMYAKLVGQEKIITQAQVFDGRDAAMDYLASDK